MMRYQCVSSSAKVVLAASSASKMLRTPSSAGTTVAADRSVGQGRLEFRREGIVQLVPREWWPRGASTRRRRARPSAVRGRRRGLHGRWSAAAGRFSASRRCPPWPWCVPGPGWRSGPGPGRSTFRRPGPWGRLMVGSASSASISRHAVRKESSPTASLMVSLPRGKAEVGEHRVAGVEQAQLGRLPRGDVGAEQRPGLLPGRPVPGEVVLDDPLHKGFGHHGGLVPEPEFTFDGVKVAVRGGRHHPVHHGAGEGHVGVQPGQQRPGFGVGKGGGERADQGSGQLPVARQVVARDDGERPGAGQGPLLDAAGDLSDGGLRRVAGKVGLDLLDRRC